MFNCLFISMSVCVLELLTANTEVHAALRIYPIQRARPSCMMAPKEPPNIALFGCCPQNPRIFLQAAWAFHPGNGFISPNGRNECRCALAPVGRQYAPGVGLGWAWAGVAWGVGGVDLGLTVAWTAWWQVLDFDNIGGHALLQDL
jgi:hypothetical protein